MYGSIKTACLLALSLCGCDVDSQLAIGETSGHRQAATPSYTETITFGVVPQQAASKLARLWVPILDHLGARMGVQIKFKTAPSLPEFERRLASGAYDIAYMNPYQYITFHDSASYDAIAKAKNKQIQGIVVVRKDSPFTELDELAGQTAAFPSPRAFGASILPRAELARRDLDIAAKHVSSHDSVYRTVAQGLYPAGGGVMRTFQAVDDDVRQHLRVLWTSQGYTPHAIAAHRRVPYEARAALVQALSELSQNPRTQALLETLALPGFEAAENHEWDDIRQLSIPAGCTQLARSEAGR